ncbi:ankyrin repeat-containing domain protein [Dactylonectria estremocensis]|uniref:Ankyrin repeat-containing domain protein n=1 Tax=Dactylonectria estremocensis TaxID=1079267 RepID=A0A9P9F2F8_9HYPO|nr:ankyrin repeat-containing domain protein [Dactylonectria estremocensis]
MAEVIGIVSGVAGLVAFAAEITKLSYSLISDLKEASQNQKLYLQEVSALTDVLFRADGVASEAELLGLTSLRPTSLSDDLIAECHDQLSRICDDLATGIKRSKWLFKEKELSKRIESLRRFHRIFLDFLSTHTLTIATESYRKIGEIGQRDQRDELLKWLNPSEETSKPAPKPVSGTGQWLIDSERYRSWRDGNPSTLWCHGAPGSGKSVLASIVFQDLKTFEPGQSYVACYFCDYATRKQQNSLSIMQSILRQLLNQAGEETILALVDFQKQAKGEPDIRILFEMIVTLCELAPPTYLILDAPDELDSPNEIMTILQRFSASGCRVLVTSRDTPDLRHALSAANNIEIQADEEDLVLFLEHCFLEQGHDKIARRGRDLIQGVVKKSKGIFLLAKILVDKLLDMTTLAQMRKSLNSMPTTITEAFESSVTRIEAQPRAKRNLAFQVIAWVTQSHRRLKADELVHALAVEEDSDEFDEDNIPDMQLALRVCVGLVIKEASDDSLGMVHTTAYEFFHGRCQPSIRRDMAATCLTYLTLPPFTLGPCKTLEEISLRKQQRPFMLYAAKFWGDYVDQNDVEHDLDALIDLLVNSPELRLSSFQALHYRPELTNKAISTELLATIPTDQQALHLAAYWNLASTTALLLQKGHDSSAKDSQQWTPLHWACYRESLASIGQLLAADADLNAQDSQGWTPLFWLAVKGNRTGMQMVLSKGANHLVRDIHGWTALTWAVSAQSKSIVQILLDHHEAYLSKLDDEPMLQMRDVTYDTAFEHSASRSEADFAIQLAAERKDIGLFDMLFSGKKRNLQDIWSQGHFDVPVSNVWRTLNKGEMMYGVERYIRDAPDSQPDEWKGKLLHGAIKDNQYMAACALIELGADVNFSLARTPLHAAAFRKDPRFARLLLQSGADPSQRDDFGRTALHQAVVNGFVETASELLSGGSDIHARAGEGGRARERNRRLEAKTALILACGLRSFQGQQESSDVETTALDMVSLLTSHNADVNMQDAKGMTALHHAAKLGNLDVVQQLMKAKADIGARDHKMRTALHFGVESANIGVVEFLVGVKSDIMAVDEDGKHMIHYLADGNRSMPVSIEDLRKMLSLLIPDDDLVSLNVSFTSTSAWNYGKDTVQVIKTALSMALESHDWTLLELLHQLGCTLPTGFDVQQHFPYAVKSLRLKTVTVLLELGATPSGDVFSLRSFDWRHFTLPGWLFPWGEIVESLDNFASILNVLLQAGLDINEVQGEGKTLLLVAAGAVDSVDLIQLLLRLGASSRKLTDDRLDAFTISALRANYNNLKTLLDDAAKSPTKNHWTESIEPTQSNNDELQRLCRALSHHNLLGDPKYYRLLEDKTDFTTLLCLSARRGNEAMSKELLSHGVDPEVMDTFGWRPLHLAVYLGSEDLVRTLLLRGADVNATTSRWPQYYSMNRPSGSTSMSYQGLDGWQGKPLHLAAMKGFPTIVELLISHGADVNAQVQGKYESPGEGPTALHLALDNGKFYGWRASPLGQEKLSIAEMLVENGADVATAADHIRICDVLKFEHHQQLWEKLRAGISEAAP